MRKLLIVAAILLSTVPLAAQQATDAPPAAPKPVEKKICRGEVHTGSIMASKRICHTKAEWSAIDGGNAKGAQQMLENRSVTGPAGPRG